MTQANEKQIAYCVCHQISSMALAVSIRNHLIGQAQPTAEQSMEISLRHVELLENVRGNRSDQLAMTFEDLRLLSVACFEEAIRILEAP